MEDAAELVENDKAELRSKSNKLYRCTWNIIQSNAFQLFIALCIFLNTIVLALDRYPISEGELKAIEYTNLLFYLVFVIEMIIKLIGLGCGAYLKDTGRVFDMFLVIISTIDSGYSYYLHLFSD